jgi:hypothetical protein
MTTTDPDGSVAALAAGTPLTFDPDYRHEIHTAEDIVDVEEYGGGFDLTRRATAPRVRVGRDKWFNLLWLIPIGFVGLVAAVAIGKGLYNMPAVQAFIQRYPGVDDRNVPAGMPGWLGWTHFFNLFMMMFIIRTGIQILCDHPRLYFSRNATPGKDEWLRVGPPVPDDELWTANADTVALPRQFGLPGFRHSIGLARWWHLGIDVLWLLNGAVFYVLLFTTGQWRHIVPTSWDVFPNAASVAIQYLSVQHWPADNGWTAYNGMQLLAYFTSVFIAPGRADHRPGHVAGALATAPLAEHTVEHPARTLAAFPGGGVLPVLHHRARHAGVCDQRAGKPQPHVRQPRRRQLDGVLGLRCVHGGDGDRMGVGDAVHHPASARGPAGRVCAGRPVPATAGTP